MLSDSHNMQKIMFNTFYSTVPLTHIQNWVDILLQCLLSLIFGVQQMQTQKNLVYDWCSILGNKLLYVEWNAIERPTKNSVYCVWNLRKCWESELCARIFIRTWRKINVQMWSQASMNYPWCEHERYHDRSSKLKCQINVHIFVARQKIARSIYDNDFIMCASIWCVLSPALCIMLLSIVE